ncbi:hypothetical protein [Endozoicomonas sp. SESOKO1]|nr:hypothetical protein [Endozoicomonas sp. SESOKO1]
MHWVVYKVLDGGDEPLSVDVGFLRLVLTLRSYAYTKIATRDRMSTRDH